MKVKEEKGILVKIYFWEGYLTKNFWIMFYESKKRRNKWILDFFWKGYLTKKFFFDFLLWI